MATNNLKQIKITSGEIFNDSLRSFIGTRMTAITKDGEILSGELRKSGSAFGLSIQNTCVQGTDDFCSHKSLKIGPKHYIKELYIHLSQP